MPGQARSKLKANLRLTLPIHHKDEFIGRTLNHPPPYTDRPDSNPRSRKYKYIGNPNETPTKQSPSEAIHPCLTLTRPDSNLIKTKSTTADTNTSATKNKLIRLTASEAKKSRQSSPF
jgi:hypothetical protein